MAQSTIFSKNEITTPTGENTFYATTTNNLSTAVDGRIKLNTIKNFVNSFDDTDFPFTASDYQTAIEILGSPEYSVLKGSAPYILIQETDNSSDDYKIQSINGDLDFFRTNVTDSYSQMMKFFVTGNYLKIFQDDFILENSVPKISFSISDSIKASMRYESANIYIQNLLGNELSISKDTTKSLKPIDFNSTMIISDYILGGGSIEQSVNVSGLWHDTINKEWNLQSNTNYKSSGNSSLRIKNLKLNSDIEFTNLTPSLDNKTWSFRLKDDGSFAFRTLSDDKTNFNDYLNFTRDALLPGVLSINSDIYNPFGKLFYTKKTGNNYNGFWFQESGIVHFITDSTRNSSGNSVIACSNISFDGGNESVFTEGDWTPSISGKTVTGDATYSIRLGSYKKNHKTLFAHFEISADNFTGTGEIVVSGLPFQPENGEGCLIISRHSGFIIPQGSILVGDVRENLSQISLRFQTNTNNYPITNSEVDSGFNLTGTLIYQV